MTLIEQTLAIAFKQLSQLNHRLVEVHQNWGWDNSRQNLPGICHVCFKNATQLTVKQNSRLPGWSSKELCVKQNHISIMLAYFFAVCVCAPNSVGNQPTLLRLGMHWIFESSPKMKAAKVEWPPSDDEITHDTSITWEQWQHVYDLEMLLVCLAGTYHLASKVGSNLHPMVRELWPYSNRG